MSHLAQSVDISGVVISGDVLRKRLAMRYAVRRSELLGQVFLKHPHDESGATVNAELLVQALEVTADGIHANSEFRSNGDVCQVIENTTSNLQFSWRQAQARSDDAPLTCSEQSLASVSRTTTTPWKCACCCLESCIHLTGSPGDSPSSTINDIRTPSARKNRRSFRDVRVQRLLRRMRSAIRPYGVIC